MNALAEYFRSQAGWRYSVAERFPDDPRNLQSAAALESLAAYVEPDEHGQYEAGSIVDSLTPFLFEGVDLGGVETGRAVSRYGYGYNVGPSQHEAFLEELVTLCLVDAYETAKSADGDDSSEVLLPFEIDAARDGVHLPQRYFERRGRSTEAELEGAVADYRDD